MTHKPGDCTGLACDACCRFFVREAREVEFMVRVLLAIGWPEEDDREALYWTWQEARERHRWALTMYGNKTLGTVRGLTQAARTMVAR